jgi:hypothetical protein
VFFQEFGRAAPHRRDETVAEWVIGLAGDQFFALFEVRPAFLGS